MMNLHFKILTFFAVINFQVMALPQKVTIWFVSPDYVGGLNLDRDSVRFSSKVAQNVLTCDSMDKGCFDPQVGYIPIDEPFKKNKESEQGKELSKLNQKVRYDSFANPETNKIDCDEDNFFDLYCGKVRTKTQLNDANYQVWVDVSASMGQSDPQMQGDHCYKRSFIENLKKYCSQRDFQVHLFNLSKWQMGGYSSLCINRGTSSTRKLIHWIESSRSKNLLVITDADHKDANLAAFIDRVGIKVVGAGAETLSYKNLHQHQRRACKALY